mgnify:CR=1 FL=1
MSFVDSDNVDNDEGLKDQASQLLKASGFNIDQDSVSYRVLLSKLKASNDLRDELLSSIFTGDSIGERELKSLISLSPVAQQLSTIEPLQPKSTKPLFSQVYAEFLAHKINKDKLSLKMQQSYERMHIVWLALVEDKPIDSYTKQDIGRFIDRCFELPRMNIGPYNKMTWEQRLEVDAPDEDLQSPKSVQQYHKWVIYLGIYTGARRGELVQLRKSDVKLDKESRRHYLIITDEHATQKLKTAHSKRLIPLHNALIDAGFIEYVKSCEDRVFYELSNVEVVTGWMPRHMASLSIPPTNEFDHIRSFHSLRHTFITKSMSEPNVNINLLQQVVGHEISSFGITSNYTHKVTDIKNLIPIIDAFEV